MHGAKILLCSFWLCTLGMLTRSSGQESFLNVLQIPNPRPITRLAENDGRISLMAGYDVGINLIEISPSGAFVSGRVIRSVGDNTFLGGGLAFYERKGSYHLISGRVQIPGGIFGLANIAFMHNFDTGETWAKRTGNIWLRPKPLLIFSNSSTVLLSQNSFTPGGPPEDSRFGLSCHILQTGALLWSRYYRRTVQNSVRTFFHLDVKEFPSGGISAIVQGTAYTPVPPLSSFYLLKLDPSGLLLRSVGILSDSIDFVGHDIAASGDVLLCGRTHIGSPYREGFIAKLDSNYTLLWAKKLSAEQFPAKGIRVRALPDGGMIFVYHTFGDLPVIAGKISTDGEILWYRGFSFFEPVVDIGADGSVFFFSAKKYFEDGSWVEAPVIAKTTAEGHINQCPQFDACLNLIEMDIPFTEYQWITEPAPELADIPVEAVPMPFDFIPHCGTPAPPSPYFVLPDTICNSLCLSPDSLANRFAHHVKWHITGPETDTLIADTSFYFCFPMPGLYNIEQEIWLLGCASFFSRSLLVLPNDSKLPLGPDVQACEPPLQLSAMSSRPLRAWQWSDGSAGPVIYVAQSGEYAVTVSDGFCELRDTIIVDFVALSLPGPAIENVRDTVVCSELLPYRLRPHSDFASLFLLEPSPRADTVFHISAPGHYTISASIEGCNFQQSFQLEIAPCPAALYLPNAFSPNQDGINDSWAPAGHDFSGVRLEIYNRWGGLIYDTTEPPFEWSGRSAGKLHSTGIYVAVFTYRNLLTGHVVQQSQEVTLLR